jgi:hypothetical protein
VFRLSFNPADRAVVAAYVQADALTDSASFEDTGAGAWPGLHNLLGTS